MKRPTVKSQLTWQQVLAVALSAIMPGLGQFYNNDKKKGAVMLAAYFLGAGLVSLSPILIIPVCDLVDIRRLPSL